MITVVQNDKKGAKWGSGPRVLVLALVAAVLAAGCSRPDAAPGPAQGPQLYLAPPAQALQDYADRLRAATTARAAAAHRWGLQRVPLPPPAPPADKPRIRTRPGFEVQHHEDWDLPPVFTTVPTRDKVVFLTIDDGAEKDPAFLRMMKDLKIPYSTFLSDYLVRDDYDYFRAVQDSGVTLNNHTLHHRYLRGRPYEEQEREICGMQDVMEREFGTRPRLFRPPYGAYDQNTLRAARSCGIRYAPIWNAEVFVDHWEFREADQRLHPGDIVLTHFRGRREWNGTMVDDMRRFLDHVTAHGFAVARLEDYLEDRLEDDA
ncbi:polysaccharide deacetylase family protein [Streptomyces thermoviolaceus]|uniref:polysaccharide deacetylase family protein n=1 Tax=Streptomyces thermoviolaceus TaxID=1952 RepID=UPI00203EB082|nr:polysaccharide deacetylase family protein [Streptomyces thermoviolaceus]MCM3263689.1 polysaccharide deacetylase family protein [Streptomyces thermoviolaceus]